MSKETVLTAKDFSKTFSNESVQQHVLKNLNLEIYKGDFTVIMGNSGSGKSTESAILQQPENVSAALLSAQCR